MEEESNYFFRKKSVYGIKSNYLVKIVFFKGEEYYLESYEISHTINISSMF
jgi:hypothetical protein